MSMEMAVEYATKAVRHDRNLAYSQALIAFEQAVVTLQKYQTTCDNVKQVEVIQGKVVGYISRINQLRALLQLSPTSLNIHQVVARPACNSDSNSLRVTVSDSVDDRSIAILPPKEDAFQELLQQRQQQPVSTAVVPPPVTKEDVELSRLNDAISACIVRGPLNVSFDSIAGLGQAKALIKEAVLLPLQQPQLFTEERAPWKSILLFGPGGTGKTLIAKAIATEIKTSCFICPSASDLISKYQGESARLIKALFERARQEAPTVMFFDEIDAICSARGDNENDSSRQIKTEMLIQMEGLGRDNKDVFILAATNLPWLIDPAIRRRFEKRVYIPLPDLNARSEILRLCLGSMPHALTTEQFEQFANQTEGMSGSDIRGIVKDALFEPVRICQKAIYFKPVLKPEEEYAVYFTPCAEEDENAVDIDIGVLPEGSLMSPVLAWEHIETVLKSARSTVKQDSLQQFENWTNEFGVEG